MNLTRKVLRRYAEDQGLPIHIYEEPYFHYLLKLYNEDVAFNEFERYLTSLSDNHAVAIEKFFDYCQLVISNVLDAIMNSSHYQEFATSSLLEYDTISNQFDKDIYVPENDGKYFISVDLQKANFQSLKSYHAGAVLYAPTYEKLIERFASETYIINSKNIRQVIFGQLNPKKQQKIQRYLIYKILSKLNISEYRDQIKLYSPSSDEIILCVNDNVLRKVIKHELFDITVNMDVLITINEFKLRRLNPYDFYVKELQLTKEVDFKKIPSYFMAQVYKFYHNIPLIPEYDLAFYFEGFIAHFDNPLKLKPLTS